MRNIRQNLGFAFAYNLIGIPVAAGVLYPTFGILLSPRRRGARDVVQFRLRHCERASAEGRAPVMRQAVCV